MRKELCVFVLCFLNTVKPSDGAKKIRIHSADIQDPRNWLPVEEEEDCEGLIFPESTNGMISLKKLNLKQLVFPQTSGQFLLSDETEIEFDADSQDPMNCIFLNETGIGSHNWEDVSSWNTEGFEENAAIPHEERLPCQYDDVVFPHGIETGIISMYLLSTATKLKSIQFGQEIWNSEDLAYYSKSEVMKQIFQGYQALDEMFFLTGQDCTDPTGCICGNEGNNLAACWWMTSPENFTCLNQVKPVGFCIEMCGAYILFRPVKGVFRIKSIENELKGYSSQTHVSKVKHDRREYIQVIFTEKEFYGTSADEAEDFHQRLLTDSALGARKVKLFSAQRRSSPNSTVGVVFGSLFVIVLVFSVVFLIYSPTAQDTVRSLIRNRLHWGMRPTFTSHFVAKYRKSDDDTGPFLDTQSVGGSVLSLEKSFENPLYGRSTPSTSSTSYDTIVPSDEKTSRSDIQTPDLDISQKFERFEDVSELVDLMETESTPA